jgi:hypothetical protein
VAVNQVHTMNQKVERGAPWSVYLQFFPRFSSNYIEAATHIVSGIKLSHSTTQSTNPPVRLERLLFPTTSLLPIPNCLLRVSARTNMPFLVDRLHQYLSNVLPLHTIP